MKSILIVFVWSGIGGSARYAMGGWVQRIAGGAFPYGTLSVNVLGSFLVMVIMQLSLRTHAVSPETRLALTTGLMGGFTTYSTFNYETLAFFERGAAMLGLANAAVTVLACLAAGALALWITRLALPA